MLNCSTGGIHVHTDTADEWPEIDRRVDCTVQCTALYDLNQSRATRLISRISASSNHAPPGQIGRAHV